MFDSMFERISFDMKKIVILFLLFLIFLMIFMFPVVIFSVSASEIADGEWLAPEFAEGDYTIAVIPDIQIMTRLYPDALNHMFDWIRANAETRKIKFVIQVGDLTDANTTDEWMRVRDNFAKLDGAAPYAFVPGNHDYYGRAIELRDTSLFNFYLPYGKYSQTSTFGGAYEEEKLDNAYYYFTAGETNYMVLCLEILPRDSVIDWANGIVADNPERRVIVATHLYMKYEGEYISSNGYISYGNGGKEIWDKFVSLHENIIMVLCGHIHNADIIMRTDKGINGNIVQQFMMDVQDMDYYRKGAGMIALLTFTNNGQNVAVNWYSTKEDALFREKNQFSFNINVKTEDNTKIPENKLPVIFFISTGGIVLLAGLVLIWRKNKAEILN